MKLLFDQNISYRIIDKISHLYPESAQVRKLGLENSTDLQIWEYARKEGFTVVTFDADFFDIANLKGYPPKIIWLRHGNLSTIQIVNLFTHKYKIIKEFMTNPDFHELACLKIESI